MGNNYTLITGATSGIGQTLAQRLSSTCNVLLLGRNEHKLDDTMALLDKSHHHLSIVCDLNSERSTACSKLTEFLLENDIQVNHFVHCAGITRIMPLKSFLPKYVDEIFNVNIFSAIELLRSLLRKANKQALTNVVFISALWSQRGEAANSIYAASKGAINSLVYSLAKELAPRARVNAVLPGGIDTPMSHEVMISEAGQKQLPDYPLGYGTVEDIVDAIEFLLSNKSKWITGTTMNVDGGRCVK